VDILNSARPDIKIKEISDGREVLPRKLYLSQPGKEVRILRGIFHSLMTSEKQARLTVAQVSASLSKRLEGEGMMEIALEATGRNVMTKRALSGEAALTFLKNGATRPVLILRMGGVEILRKIRADAKFSETPVIVVSSSSLPLEKDEAYAPGANGYLLKSIDFMQFSKDMEFLLDRWIPT